MYYKYPISDVHIHAFNLDFANQTLAMAEELGYEHFVMLSGNSIIPEIIGNNLLCAYIKLKSKGKGYAFAACHYPDDKGTPSAEDMLGQVKLYHELGFDGIKMMDGKPGMRLKNGVALNDPVYDPMFKFMVEKDIPLLYHVNDPYEFWNWDLMPDWAKVQGKSLCYAEGGYPTKQKIEDEAVDILNKHPNLRVIFAHWFFTSTDIERTRFLFEKYPNMCYDITPGWEMFESFAQNYDEWRQFFIDYSQRIFFGTDTISGHWRETVKYLRMAMETDEEFVAFEESCKGLKLEGKPLQNIYKNNFDNYLPHPPKAMDMDGLLRYGETLYNRIENYKVTDKNKAKNNLIEAMEALKNL